MAAQYFYRSQKMTQLKEDAKQVPHVQLKCKNVKIKKKSMKLKLADRYGQSSLTTVNGYKMTHYNTPSFRSSPRVRYNSPDYYHYHFN